MASTLKERGDARLLHTLAAHLRPLHGTTPDDELLAFVAQGRIVLLGEASHGTHEFYELRARLTQRLVAEHGFTAVVAEADWPDAWRVNRYVRSLGEDASAERALAGFERFPTWMWRNTAVRDFVEWLRAHNAKLPRRRQAGFYGMDMYSLFASIQKVLDYLDRTDPEAARRARARYACFDHYGEDSQAYGYAASFGLKPHCEDEVVQQLREMNRRAASFGTRPGMERDEAFFAQQNARLVRNAEEYYRSMFHRKVSSWNLRDQHMMETLEALDAHLKDDGPPPRMVVWAHNSHLGDASATEMGERGEWNVGQLARERWGQQAMLVGFSTYTGTVAAASAWDAPVERKRVREGLPGSCEELFHETAEPNFWLPLRENPELQALLAAPRLQRAIGVIYMPQTERISHYFETRLPQQFDVMAHLDRTRAVDPLDEAGGWSGMEPPETYPSGL
ncbi:erythromycin esterase family protein [Ramlibacter rhizophilus]|uniref:Erythromycin esterase family protein n=1 Tax=Ramlibacter rhizophilus TaxID=1781167 RepID=A0A4Z0C0Z1_9BURK|nr:erythromycin esterase family protein [Ramlibacter rhizophilus]TFZ04881.1 erythromycin esterase family protein [Ramlibacter rhizophilus]